jgi:tetrahydromethanopterin S-methyltransferase subunit A
MERLKSVGNHIFNSGGRNRMKAPFAIFTLLYVNTPTAIARTLLSHEDSWETLSAAFGTHLQSTFGNPKTLEHATTANYIPQSDIGYRVLCTNYEGGHLIGMDLQPIQSIS